MTGLLERFGYGKKRDMVVKWGMTTFTAIILASLSICLYWVVLDRKLPIEIHRGEIILYQRQIDDSWVFVVRWHGTLKRRCGGLSNRWIVDGFRLPLADIHFPAESEPTQIGEEFSWEVPVQVPAYFVSTGHVSGQYRARFLYHCNPLQERIFPIADNPPYISFTLPVEAQPGSPVVPDIVPRAPADVGTKPKSFN